MTHAVLAAEAAVPLTCGDCGEIDGDLSWRVFINGTIHVEARCPSCNRWLQYMKQTPYILALLPPPPTAPEQAGLW